MNMNLNLLQALASQPLDEGSLDRITAAAKKWRNKGTQQPTPSPREKVEPDLDQPAFMRKQAATPAAPATAATPVDTPAAPAVKMPAAPAAAKPAQAEARTWEAYKKAGIKPQNPGSPDTKPGVSTEAAQHITTDFVKHLLSEWELFVSHGFKMTPALRGQVKQMALELGNFVKAEATVQSTEHLLSELQRISAQILVEKK